MVRLLLVVAAVVATAGCAGLSRNPVPIDAQARARIPDMPEVRGWAAVHSPAMERDFELSLKQERPGLFAKRADGRMIYPQLALSGGGPNGAFGAAGDLFRI